MEPIKKRPLYREEIKKALMDAIMSRELKPGDRIVETRWAKRLGVSQSPIREAIRELEMTGIVENIPYKGSIVRQISAEDISNTFRVRAVLEKLAVGEFIDHGNRDLLPELKKYLDAMIEDAKEDEIDRFSQNDSRFHEIIVEGSGNNVLLRVWRNCQIADNTKITVMLSDRSIIELAKRHESIYRTLEKGNREEAEKEIEEHFISLIEGMEEMKKEEEA